MNINTYNLLRKGGEWRTGGEGGGYGKDKIPFSGGLTPVLDFLVTCVLNIKVSIAI